MLFTVVITLLIFCCYSVVKQLCFDDGSPDENSRDLLTIQVYYCRENEGWTFVNISVFIYFCIGFNLSVSSVPTLAQLWKSYFHNAVKSMYNCIWSW